MATKYKKYATLPQKAIFWTYTTAVNGTAIGWAAAGAIAVQTALDVDAEDVVRKGSVALASFLIPGSVCLAWVQSADKYYYFGRKVLGYGSKAYTIGKYLTSPMAAINYVGAKFVQKAGVTTAMKFLCGVEECDDFYWEMPQYSPIA